MTFAGQRDVELAREAHADRAPRLPRPQRRYGGIRVRLNLLAPERPTHPQALNSHLITGDTEHPRDDLLGFGRMLSRRVDRHAAGFVDPRNGRLRFEIEVLLPAYPQLSLNSQRARVNHRAVAVDDAVLAGEKACRGNCPFDRENRGQRLI